MAKKQAPGKTTRKGRTPPRNVEVLATLLVAYPQVSRVAYDPANKALALVFLCRGPLSQSKRRRLASLYKDSVEVYLSLTDRRPAVIKTAWEELDSFYSFQVERDVSSLSPGELDMTVELICERAGGVVGSEDLDPEAGELGWPARVFLQETIDQVSKLKSSKKIVALREGEKVLVFDK